MDFRIKKITSSGQEDKYHVQYRTTWGLWWKYVITNPYCQEPSRRVYSSLQEATQHIKDLRLIHFPVETITYLNEEGKDYYEDHGY